MTPELALAVLGGAFAVAFVVGLSGFADALVGGAIWLHVFPPPEAVPLIVATGLASHLLCLHRVRDAVHWPRLAPFVAGGVVGVPVGVGLLGTAEPSLVRLGVGILLCLVAGWQLAGGARHPHPVGGALRGPAPLADSGVGLAGGVLGGLAGLSGVLPTLWAGLRGWSADAQRALYQPFIILMHVLTLAALALAGLLDGELLARFALALPAVVAGVWLGLRLYGRLDERRFRQSLLALLLASGLLLLVRA